MVFNSPKAWFRLSLEGRLLAAMSLLIVITAGTGFGFQILLNEPWLALLLSLLLGLSVAFCLVRVLTRGLRLGMGAIDHGLLNLMDNDFSITLAASGLDEVDRIGQRYNQLVNTLRQERQSIFQRELLLDTVIEKSSMCVLITDQNRHIIYSNRIAQNVLNQGRAVRGLKLHDLLGQEKTLLDAIEREQSGIFKLDNQHEGLHHLSCGRFVLNAQNHRLILIKEVTREINRQEAAIWKKAIRVISHELNNSLAPISSLAHSGQLMLQKGQYKDLPDVFATLAERAEHLRSFVGSYAQIAKLPRPNKTAVEWQTFYQSLVHGSPFGLVGELPGSPGYFDAGQIHQVMLNLLKNAAESGSPVEEIQLSISQGSRAAVLIVTDRGAGMSTEILQNALLPFYSTKPTGSGVGLPLCREVIEAHDGHLSFSNRRHGGLRVEVTLPLPLPLDKLANRRGG